jgi:DnaJ domain
MRHQPRSNDWGFPRWRGYGTESGASKVKPCDRYGCTGAGEHPAPKAPNSSERWYFCQPHAAEYNRQWDYFAGLSPEEAAAREAQERLGMNGFRQSSHDTWAGSGDGSQSRDELKARDVLEVEVDASFEDIKLAWRRLAKSYHPDVKPNDKEAAMRFQQIQAAYEVLRTAEERRLALGARLS